MAKILVVGGNGFIGSYVVDALAVRGHDIAVFDRFGDSSPRYLATGVEAIAGDFLNVGEVRAAVRDREIVLHFLSTTDPASAEDDPTLDIRTNVTSSVDLFQICVEEGVRKVFFASTGGAIYGDQDEELFGESDQTLPVSPYAIGKLTIENYLRYFRRKHGLAYTVFRISNPYGPRQNPAKRQGVIPIFLRHVAHSEPVQVFGDGSMVRDYLYVEDLAEMVATAVTQGTTKDLYNLGAGMGNTVNEVIAAIRRATDREVTVTNTPTPPTFVHRVTLDIDRYVSEFGAPRLTGLDEGISKTWEEMSGDVSV